MEQVRLTLSLIFINRGLIQNEYSEFIFICTFFGHYTSKHSDPRHSQLNRTVNIDECMNLVYIELTFDQRRQRPNDERQRERLRLNTVLEHKGRAF